MKKHNNESSIFLENKISISDLKASTFFWENLCVYEFFISTLPERPELYDISRLLLEKGILKIAMTEGEEFRDHLNDKTYAGMDSEFYNFLCDNSEKITITAKLQSNTITIIKESAELEYANKELQRLLDSSYHKLVQEEDIKELHLNKRVHPFDQLPKSMQKRFYGSVEKLTNLTIKQYEKRDSNSKYGFEWKNKSLLLKNSICSSILASKYELPYYYYKFNNFRKRDANYFIEGLKATIPIVKRESIDDFSFEDILEIRKNTRWKNAMNRLGEICNNVKYELNTDEFKEEIKDVILSEALDALDENKVGGRHLVKSILKNTVMTGISFIPLVGTPISTLSDIVDPIQSHLKDVEKQKNLSFFLSDIKLDK